MTRSKQTVAGDVECYRNFFLMMFKNVDTGSVRGFSATGENNALSPDDIATIRKILRTYRLVTFNGRGYDIPMLILALTGATCKKLKDASDAIIQRGVKPWDFERLYNIKLPELDHVDVIDIAFGTASLKIYGGRLHCKRMADLPYDPSSVLTQDEINVLTTYCANDLSTTIELFNHLKEPIDLRRRISEEYGVNVVSKSDAQIAEAILKKQLEDLKGQRISRPGSRAGDLFKFQVPDFIKFNSEQLQNVLELVKNANFVVDEKDTVLLPDALAAVRVEIGSSTYRMGIGGLHSSEESVTHHADDKHFIRDADCTSFYPNIILNLGLYPKHLGTAFLDVYRKMVDRRIVAKKRAAELQKEIAKATEHADN